MKIIKSTRHNKIIGNFGEALLCNWLSRSGFEVTIIDHTGIDLVAYNPSTQNRHGITVKSRTREKGKENTAVNIFSYQKGKDDRKKVLDACDSFACRPWIGIYVETTEFADLYLLSLDHYDQKYRGPKGRAIDNWKMGEKYKKAYNEDQNIRHLFMDFTHSPLNWF